MVDRLEKRRLKSLVRNDREARQLDKEQTTRPIGEKSLEGNAKGLSRTEDKSPSKATNADKERSSPVVIPAKGIKSDSIGFMSEQNRIYKQMTFNMNSVHPLERGDISQVKLILSDGSITVTTSILSNDSRPLLERNSSGWRTSSIIQKEADSDGLSSSDEELPLQKVISIFI